MAIIDPYDVKAPSGGGRIIDPFDVKPEAQSSDNSPHYVPGPNMDTKSAPVSNALPNDMDIRGMAESTTPEGVRSALKGTDLRTAAEMGGLMGGAAIGAKTGAMMGSPAGPPGMAIGGAVGGLVGGGIGYAITKGTSDVATGKAKGGVEGFKEAGKDVATGMFMEGTGQVGGVVIPKAVEGIGVAAKQVLGRLTGGGVGFIEESVKSGQKTGMSLNPFKSKTDYDKAIRGEISGQDIVDNARSALQVLKDNRASEYQAKLANISSGGNLSAAQGQQTAPIDPKPIISKLQGLAKQFRIGLKVNPKGEAIVDVSQAAMGKEGRNEIAEVIKDIGGWTDFSPIGLDALKRRVADFYSESSQARAFVKSMESTINDTIVKAVPEYKEMTKGYAEATKLIKDIEAGLMMKKQGLMGRVTGDQTLRRLLSSMRDNFELRKDLVKSLSTASGEDILGQIGGYTGRSIVPLGLAGTGPAMVGEAMLAKFVNPHLWPILAASSPRLVGEFLRLYGKGLAELAGTSPMAGKAAAYGATRPTSE